MAARDIQLEYCKKWIEEACVVLELPSILAIEYLSCFTTGYLGLPSLSPTISAPAVLYLASLAVNGDECIDIDFLSHLTHRSISSDQIYEAVKVLLPLQQRFPHPSMFYCQLFSNWLYEAGICTRHQSLLLSPNCLNSLTLVEFSVLCHIPSVELSLHLITQYCDIMVIPTAKEYLSDFVRF
ncbi:hypothetical protein GEMRC1_001162 [Eukaryota sp. GEM-RC1]